MDFTNVQITLMGSVTSILALALIIVSGYAAIWAINKCIRVIRGGSTGQEDVVWSRENHRWESENGNAYNGDYHPWT